MKKNIILYFLLLFSPLGANDEVDWSLLPIELQYKIGQYALANRPGLIYPGASPDLYPGTVLEPEVSLVGHRDIISGICFSFDGKKIATCSMDGTIRIWNAGTGEEYTCIHSTHRLAPPFGFNQAGTHVLCSIMSTNFMSDPFVRTIVFIWNIEMIEKGERVDPVKIGSGGSIHRSFFTRYDTVATWDTDFEDYSHIEEWDPNTGNMLRRFDCQLIGPCVLRMAEIIRDLLNVPVPDGNCDYRGLYVQIKDCVLYDAETFWALAKLQAVGGRPLFGLFDLCGSRFAIAGLDNIVRIWDIVEPVRDLINRSVTFDQLLLLHLLFQDINHFLKKTPRTFKELVPQESERWMLTTFYGLNKHLRRQLIERYNINMKPYVSPQKLYQLNATPDRQGHQPAKDSQP